MRQKKTNIIPYIVGLVLLGVVGLVVFTEIPLNVEHVEEVVK